MNITWSLKPDPVNTWLAIAQTSGVTPFSVGEKETLSTDVHSPLKSAKGQEAGETRMESLAKHPRPPSASELLAINSIAVGPPAKKLFFKLFGGLSGKRALSSTHKLKKSKDPTQRAAKRTPSRAPTSTRLRGRGEVYRRLEARPRRAAAAGRRQRRIGLARLRTRYILVDV